jgi:predicted metal-dependent hydrolase
VGKFIINHSSGSDIQNVFKNWFINKAKEKITPRIKYHARNIGVKYDNILIMDMKYRWGSCTPNNNLCINWRLIKAPMSVIDYVIVHELAHLLELNHTPKFWNIVRAQTPDYERAKQWLKEHGEILESEF